MCERALNINCAPCGRYITLQNTHLGTFWTVSFNVCICPTVKFNNFSLCDHTQVINDVSSDSFSHTRKIKIKQKHFPRKKDQENDWPKCILTWPRWDLAAKPLMPSGGEVRKQHHFPTSHGCAKLITANYCKTESLRHLIKFARLVSQHLAPHLPFWFNLNCEHQYKLVRVKGLAGHFQREPGGGAMFLSQQSTVGKTTTQQQQLCITLATLSSIHAFVSPKHSMWLWDGTLSTSKKKRISVQFILVYRQKHAALS